MGKPRCVWDHQHEFWRRDGGSVGAKWFRGKWLACWVEPGVGENNCWYPGWAGQFVSFGFEMPNPPPDPR